MQRMDLSLPRVPIEQFRNGAQIARVLTETWGTENLYCVACSSDTLAPTGKNFRAIDFVCPICDECYQLKSGKKLPGTRIVDAGYEAMIASIRSEKNPNLLYLHYEIENGVQNLMLIPKFFFAEACIEKRKPLAVTARRAGWIGCNIRLDLIASEGRIPLVRERREIP